MDSLTGRPQTLERRQEGWARTAEDGAVAGEDGGADAEAAVRAVGVLLGGERGARELVERGLVDGRRRLVRGLCTHTHDLSGLCLSSHYLERNGCRRRERARRENSNTLETATGTARTRKALTRIVRRRVRSHETLECSGAGAGAGAGCTSRGV